jgi:hypothetical protein
MQSFECWIDGLMRVLREYREEFVSRCTSHTSRKQNVGLKLTEKK